MNHYKSLGSHFPNDAAQTDYISSMPIPEASTVQPIVKFPAS